MSGFSCSLSLAWECASVGFMYSWIAETLFVFVFMKAVSALRCERNDWQSGKQEGKRLHICCNRLDIAVKQRMPMWSTRVSSFARINTKSTTFFLT